MLKGRPAGIHLTFDQAYAVACTFGGHYWFVEGDNGLFACWHGDTYLGAASTRVEARHIVVRDFARRCVEGERESWAQEEGAKDAQ